MAEHLTFNQGVRGSNPRWLTKPVPLEWGLGGIAQLVRVPASHAGGHRFEPCCLHQNATSKRPLLWAFGVAFYLFSYYNRTKKWDDFKQYRVYFGCKEEAHYGILDLFVSKNGTITSNWSQNTYRPPVEPGIYFDCNQRPSSRITD